MSAGGEIGELAEATLGPLALHLLGILRAHEGRYDEAEEALLGAVKAGPEMAGSYVELGLVYACRGEYVKMAEALGKAVEVGGGGARAYLGEQPLGDAPDTLMNTAASGHAEPAHSAAAAAITYLAQGRDREAAAMLKEGLRAREERPPVLVTLLALTYLLSGEAVDVDEDGSVRTATPSGVPADGR